MGAETGTAGAGAIGGASAVAPVAEGTAEGMAAAAAGATAGPWAESAACQVGPAKFYVGAVQTCMCCVAAERGLLQQPGSLLLCKGSVLQGLIGIDLELL